MSASAPPTEPLTVVSAPTSTGLLAPAPITLTANFGLPSTTLTPELNLSIEGSVVSIEPADILTSVAPEETSTQDASSETTTLITSTVRRDVSPPPPPITTAEATSRQGISSKGALLAGIIIASVASLIAVGILLYLFCNKSRRKRIRTSGRTHMRQVGLGVWIRNGDASPPAPPVPSKDKPRTDRRNTRFSGVFSSSMRTPSRTRSRGGLVPEGQGVEYLPPLPFTTATTMTAAGDTAASLDDDPSSPSARRSSWMSRVSRLLARAARSNTTITTSTRTSTSFPSRRRTTTHTKKSTTNNNHHHHPPFSSPSSRPSTSRSSAPDHHHSYYNDNPSSSGDWSAFVRQHHPGGLTMPAMVNPNERSFLSTTASVVDGAREAGEPPIPSPAPVKGGDDEEDGERIRRISMFSGGTFGNLGGSGGGRGSGVSGSG